MYQWKNLQKHVPIPTLLSKFSDKKLNIDFLHDIA